MPVKYNILPELTAQQVNNFWNKVKIQPNGCWEWQASLDNQGYGKVGIGKRDSFRCYKTHRVAYKIYYMAEPFNLCVCHRCDNRICVNPLHLFLGTHTDNAVDRENKGRGKQPSGNKNGKYTKPESTVRGENHCRAKMTDADIVKMRAAFSNGVSQSALACRFGVSRQTIWKIVNRITWTHI